MPTSCISFLHLGDVHYPELLKARPLADHKDKGLSPAMVNTLSSSRVTEIMRGISQIRKEETNLVAVVMNGDLTTIGDVSGYKDCLTFLHNALQISDHVYWKDRRLLVVPGNHDILRSAIVNGQPLLDKFDPLLEQWERIFGSRDYLTVQAPTPTDLPPPIPGASRPSVRFLPINTCIFCGEYRAIPEAIRDTVINLLNKLKSSISGEEFENMMSEQIDCPAVCRDDVITLQKHIAESDVNSVSVTIGHHPLFAQPMPRIGGYNELLNAGFIRESVLETRRNVVYLHGHIHQGPMLLVSNPILGTHRLIHVSAPALIDGFNLVRIFFSNDTNQPLGLELTQYRFGDHLGASIVSL